MMIIATLLVLVVLVACFVTSDTEWSDYKVKYNKVYKTLEEEQFRKNIFGKSNQDVEKHNKMFKEGLVSFTIGINQFSDMTDEERRQFVNCLDTSKMRSSKLQHAQYVRLQNITIPAKMDWRDKGAVTRVKDQGDCGSCWAFSATGAIESQYFLKNRKLVELSEQNLIDCSKQNNGCMGGYAYKAFKYIVRNGGIDTEDSYPYESKERECRFKKDSIGAAISKCVYLKEGDEEVLRQAVALKGPISVAIYVDHYFMKYKEGVFNYPNCNHPANHAVLVVGYGTDPSGVDYWIVKNSWGEGWGMKGYVWMSRNKNNQCGISTDASYPIIK